MGIACKLIQIQMMWNYAPPLMGVYGVIRVEKLLKLAGGEGAEMVWLLLHLILKAVMNLWRILMILTTLGKEKAVGKTRYCECSPWLGSWGICWDHLL